MFSRPPRGNYEYCNPCKFARSETIKHSDDELGSSDDNSDKDSDSDDDTYDKISSLPFAPTNQSTADSKRRSFQLTKPDAPSIPVKTWRSLENESKQEAKTIGKHVTTKPCPELPDLDHEKTKEPVSTPSTLTHRLGTKQPAQTTVDLLYEPLNSPPVLTVNAAYETMILKQDNGESSKESRPQHQVNPQQPAPRVLANPGKKQPPPTKPKTLKQKPVVVSPSPVDINTTPTAVCRVNPVKPFADSGVSCPSQSPTAPGYGKNNWKSAHDVPANLENLSVEQVAECMKLLHLSKLAAAFKSHDVDGKLLVNIVSEEVLVADFNCSGFEAKKVVAFVNNKWRPNE